MRNRYFAYLIALPVLMITMQSAIWGQKASPTPVKQEQPTGRATGTFEGTVIDDEGKPIPDARVGIAVVGDNQNFQGVGTDESGKFQLTRLRGEIFRAYVQASSYVMSPQDQRLPGDPPRYFHSGERAVFTMIKGGVITGTVVDAAGTPVIGINVVAVRVAEPADVTDDFTGFYRTRETDDRGIYRFYGLPAGHYVVAAGAGIRFSNRLSPYDRNSPTYYPSATRDTASPVFVGTGQEVADIDIHYRGEPGFAVSGKVVGPLPKNLDISLRLAGDPGAIVNSSVRDPATGTFDFYGIPNGDYRLYARSYDDGYRTPLAEGSATVTVKNADVTGFSISLHSFSSIRGRISPSQKTETGCENRSPLQLTRSVLTLQPLEKDNRNEGPISRPETAVDTSGTFSILGLRSGSYRLRTTLQSNDWYISSITRDNARPAARATAAPNSLSIPELVSLANSQNLTGISINVVPGGGSIRGRLTRASESVAVPNGLRFFLIPADKERADDVLRYSEASIDTSGNFMLKNLAPGNYLIATRVLRPAGTEDFRAAAWDAKERVKLRREAEAANIMLEIKPCQGPMDLTLIFGADGSVKKP